jgi:LysR family transcriptional regulator for bpeEF and oprC
MDRLHGILVFLRIVEYGTLSGAARSLGVSTAAVSSTLTRLERQLAVKLLSRTTRRLNVTPEGAEFYARCKQITSDLAEAELMVGRAGQVPSGRLRVRLPLPLGRMWIVPYLHRFTRDYPSISVEVVCRDFVPHTIEDGLDISVQTGELHHSSLAVRRLATTDYVVCAAPSYFAGRESPRSIEDLVEHSCIAYRRPRNGRLREWRFKSGSAIRHLPVNGPVTFNNIDLLIEAATAGMGIIQVPACYAQPALERGELVETLLDHKAGGYEISAVYLQQQRAAPKIRVFMNFLVALFNPPPWSLPSAGKGDAAKPPRAPATGRTRAAAGR